MQWLGIFFFSLLGYGVKELAMRALVGVGFGLVTTYGIYTFFDQIHAHFQAQLTGLPADVLAMLGIMKIDVCFTIILSAAGAKQALRGWNKILDRRVDRVWRRPTGGGNIDLPF